MFIQVWYLNDKTINFAFKIYNNFGEYSTPYARDVGWQAWFTFDKSFSRLNFAKLQIIQLF